MVLPFPASIVVLHPDLKSPPAIPQRGLAVALLLSMAVAMSGCAVVAVADAAITVGATAVKAGASVVGAAVDVTSAGVRAATGSAKKD